MHIYNYFIIILCLLTSPLIFAQNIESYDYYLPYQNDQKLYLKEKKLPGANKVIVLINPLSIPALNAFDIPNYSLMDTLAENGFDVWGIDFIGQGQSTYPEIMQENPAPIGLSPLRASEATLQLESAIKFILHKTKHETFSLLGWSWGSIVAAMYAIEHPKQVDHLILYGAMNGFLLPPYAQELFIKPYASPSGTFSKKLPAYQNIPWEIVETHWRMMLQDNETIVANETFKTVGNIYRTIDSHPFKKGTVRRPMGPMKDLFLIWNNQPIYDAQQLTTATLVIYGYQDIFADPNLFYKLTQVKNKKEVKVEEATHWLIYEKKREIFNCEVINFLNNFNRSCHAFYK